jgi:surfactin synthase thioesterase subunit
MNAPTTPTTTAPAVPSPRVSDQAERWIRRYGPARDAAPLLVCLPHAGGAATFFHPLSDLLGERAEVWAIQYPGRQDRFRDPFCSSMQELVRAVAAAVLVVAGDRPVTLFGHSMGSLVGFEVARILERAGRPARHLVASGRGAPSIPFTGDVATGSDDDLVAELLRMEGTDPTVLADRQLLELALPAVRADYRLIHHYAVAPEASVSCPVTVLHGDRDPLAPPAEVELWGAHTTGSLRLREFPGGHFYLVDNARDVAEELVRCLS